MTQSYNSRQFRLMAEVCESYLNSQTSISSTIGLLEGLIHALEAIPSDLRNELLSRVGVLEDLFAASLERPDDNVLEEYAPALVRATTEIRDAAHKRASEDDE